MPAAYASTASAGRPDLNKLCPTRYFAQAASSFQSSRLAQTRKAPSPRRSGRDRQGNHPGRRTNADRPGASRCIARGWRRRAPPQGGPRPGSWPCSRFRGRVSGDPELASLPSTSHASWFRGMKLLCRCRVRCASRSAFMLSPRGLPASHRHRALEGSRRNRSATRQTRSMPSPVVADARASPAVFRIDHGSGIFSSIAEKILMHLSLSDEPGKYLILGMDVWVPRYTLKFSP